MRKTSLFIFSLLYYFVLEVNAQKIQVSKFNLDKENKIESQYLKFDSNDNPCALIKVHMSLNTQMPKTGIIIYNMELDEKYNVDFEGNVVEAEIKQSPTPPFFQSEHWVYVPSGNKNLKVKVRGYINKEVRFEDFGIAKVEGGRIYHLVLDAPRYNQYEREDNSKYIDYYQGDVEVLYGPVGADIYLDGNKKGTSPGILKNVTEGYHTIEIKHKNYITEQIILNVQDKKTISINGFMQYSSIEEDISKQNKKWYFNVNDVDFWMILVEGGKVKMRSGTKIDVKNFFVGETEVTQELWQAVMRALPQGLNEKDKKHPVTKVTWYDCDRFVKELSRKTGVDFCLPASYEWEYARKGGNRSLNYMYSGSNILEDVAWTESDTGGVEDVKNKQPNELGLYDVSGNAKEWCSDTYSPGYAYLGDGINLELPAKNMKRKDGNLGLRIIFKDNYKLY